MTTLIQRIIMISCDSVCLVNMTKGLLDCNDVNGLGTNKYSSSHF